MPTKSDIVAVLGEGDLLLPEKIAEALSANDRVKYYFALFQMARAEADRPSGSVQDLKAERMACRIGDDRFDGVIAATRRSRHGGYAVPHARVIMAGIIDGIDTMLACLPDEARQIFAARKAAVLPKPLPTDEIDGAAIDRMTSGDRAKGDSLHIVVMDAHKAINALQAETSVETLAGARVHGLSPRGRALVEAFMAGIARTLPLKFDHPGLGTTATEHAGRVLIQNDIGTTDAHVLVVRVDGLTTTVTYTDIHRQRLKFFQGLFAEHGVDWADADTRSSDRLESKSYLLTTGTHRARDQAGVEAYLAHLGSRLVFLIDWNKARKRFQAYVSKDAAIDVLRWAAINDVGHRGLLEIGGEAVLSESVEFAAGEGLRYGDRLDTLIGGDRAAQFLRRACALASDGLLQRRSRRIIADEIKAELARTFETTALGIFSIAARHAACGFDLAISVREALDVPASERDTLDRLAHHAAQWETRADQLLNDARDDARRFKRPLALVAFLESADDAVDELEEVAALIALMPLVPVAPAALAPLRQLADAALAAAQELVKCVACAAAVTSADVRDDLDDFLTALDRLIAIEHQADELMRSTRRAIVTSATDPRAIYLLDQVARGLEEATDAYVHAGQSLRGYLMEEVLA